MQYGHGRVASRRRVFGVTSVIGLRSPVTTGAHPRSISSRHGKVTPATDAGTTPFKMADKAFSTNSGELKGSFHLSKGAPSRERGSSGRRGHTLPLGSHVRSANQDGAGSSADGRPFDRRPSGSSRTVTVRRPKPPEQRAGRCGGRGTVRAVRREGRHLRRGKGVKFAEVCNLQELA